MEIHPILDDGTQLATLKTYGCYLLSAEGNAPSARVGHMCICASENGRTVIYFIGGANPDGSFAEMPALDMQSWKWDLYPSMDFTGRYEHAAFMEGDFIYVYGGANITGNLNEVQKWDLTEKKWLSVESLGDDIGARTHHTSAVIDGKLIIFSGGHSGADPVADDRVHVFDAKNSSWSTPTIEGDVPSPRQGHLMVAINDKVYLHGGMAGNKFYDDFHVLNFETLTWKRLDVGGGQPSARAAHGGVVCDRRIILFGGMNDTGALNDMNAFDTESLQWTAISFTTAPPAPRLDFAMCTFQTSAEGLSGSSKECKEKDDDNEAGSRSMSEPPTSCKLGTSAGTKNESATFILIHGGMNTDGDIYDDCFVIKI